MCYRERCYKEILSAEEDRVETGLARDDMEATGIAVNRASVIGVHASRSLLDPRASSHTSCMHGRHVRHARPTDTPDTKRMMDEKMGPLSFPAVLSRCPLSCLPVVVLCLEHPVNTTSVKRCRPRYRGKGGV